MSSYTANKMQTRLEKATRSSYSQFNHQVVGFLLLLILTAVLVGCSSDEGQSTGNNTYTLSGVILDENNNGINEVTISYTGAEDKGILMLMTNYIL